MQSSNLQRGIKLFELERYKEAISYFQEDISLLESKYYMALCHYNLSDYTKAEHLANELLGDSPYDDAILALKSQIATQKDKLKDALTFIDEAISINPYNADYFALKGAILLGKRDLEKALEQVNAGLSIESKHAYCLNLRAQILTKLKRTEEATQTVENLLSDHPNDSHSQANVGWVELENGNITKALNHFKEALLLNPNDEYSRHGMSTALKAKNFVYRNYLKYEFWMANKNSTNQWIFIIGIYLAYRFGVKFLNSVGFSYLTIPLVIAYLLFALGGWMMQPLSNSILNFDSYGKYLLSKDEKYSGYVFALLLVLAVVCALGYLISEINLFLPMSIGFFCALLPLPRSFILHSKNARLFGKLYGIFIILGGFITPFFIDTPSGAAGIIFLMLVAYTWIANFIK